MELKLVRKVRSEVSTIGDLSIDGVFECHVLEDKDRGLLQSMKLSEVEKLKKKGITAIPAGRYEIALTFSNAFQKYLPLLIEVPAYAGVRIHSGNTAEHSLGCLLVGTYDKKTPDFVGGSRLAFDALFKKLKAVEKKEKIFITIV